jgi:hypothetical protein
MPPRLKSKVSRPSWRTPYPNVYTDEFALVNTNTVTNQLPLNSNPGRNLYFISKFIVN